SCKNNVYRNNPHTTDELKENIRTEIRKITEKELIRVNANLIKRCQKCVAADGHHFQHRLSSSVLKNNLSFMLVL
ncbi:hypothetical protein C0J52_22055, partial [Blattella germanica]